MMIVFSKSAGGTRFSFSLDEELLDNMGKTIKAVSEQTGESCSRIFGELMAKHWPLMRTELQERLNQSQG